MTLPHRPLLSPQKPGFCWPRLLLSGPAEVRTGCGLHRAGDRSALPSLHLERLFSQITLRVHAPAANHRSLPLLHHDGAESQEVVAAVRHQRGFRISNFSNNTSGGNGEPYSTLWSSGLVTVCKYSFQDLLSSVWVAESFTILISFFSPLFKCFCLLREQNMFAEQKWNVSFLREHIYYLRSRRELLDVISVWMI